MTTRDQTTVICVYLILIFFDYTRTHGCAECGFGPKPSLDRCLAIGLQRKQRVFDGVRGLVFRPWISRPGLWIVLSGCNRPLSESLMYDRHPMVSLRVILFGTNAQHRIENDSDFSGKVAVAMRFEITTPVST